MDKPDMSRRQVMSGAGLVTVAAVAPLAAAAQTPTGQAQGNAMQDPTTKSPKPPFPAQEQPWPGLTSNADASYANGQVYGSSGGSGQP